MFRQSLLYSSQTQKILCSHSYPHQQRPSEDPRPPNLRVSKTPNSSSGWCQGNLSRDPRPSLLPHSKKPSAATRSVETTSGAGFLPTVMRRRERETCKKGERWQGHKCIQISKFSVSQIRQKT